MDGCYSRWLGFSPRFNLGYSVFCLVVIIIYRIVAIGAAHGLPRCSAAESAR